MGIVGKKASQSVASPDFCLPRQHTHKGGGSRPTKKPITQSETPRPSRLRHQENAVTVACPDPFTARGTMPPHLHPRSRMTSSLFATTVFASFFVVALPHVLPCPVPRTKFADGEVIVDENGRRKRWRKRETPETKSGIVQFDQPAGEDACDGGLDRTRRECPVPKPGGILGEWLGFCTKDDQTGKKRDDR
ncbi:hypothetical protein CDD83_384 [Cordyceps sp. RAO-2017]|nr:hypothetical protein CDD83_384 [Cordyceps sp. RAO-2017]